MPICSAEQLKDVGYKIFKALGVSDDESKIVTNSLVESNLVGHDSHGVIRIPQYANSIRNGSVVPGAKLEVIKETPNIAVLNGNWGFGQVMARKAMEIAIDKASNRSISAVTLSQCYHIARLGEYASMAANEDMIGIIMVNNHGGGQCMAPWGGTARRLSPNPISIALPTGTTDHVLLDMTTAVVAEGKIRVKLNRGERLPEGCIIDSNGNPSIDPKDFYGPPPGAILPFGGIVGYKGYGLGFIIDILSGALSGAGCSRANPTHIGNGVFISVINIKDFVTLEEFKTQVDELIKYVKSSPKMPGFSEIMFPGEVEANERRRRLKTGIFIEDETWNQILALAKELKINISL